MIPVSHKKFLTYNAGKLIGEQVPLMMEVLGDLKESPSLGKSSRMTFSRTAKYSSLTVLHIFRTTVKSY